VYTVERHKTLAKSAKKRLQALDITNVTVLASDGTTGLATQAPFDRIIVTAAAEDVPPVLIDQLAMNGILVIPVGVQESTQTLIKVMKTEQGLDYKELNNVRFVPLLEGTV